MRVSLNLIIEKSELDPDYVSSNKTPKGIEGIRVFGRGIQQIDSKKLYIVLPDEYDYFIKYAFQKVRFAIIIGEVNTECLKNNEDIYYALFIKDKKVSDIINVLIDTLEKINNWKESVKIAILQNISDEEVLKLGFDFMGNPMILWDNSFAIRASTKKYHERPNDDDWENLIDAGYWLPEVRSTVIFEYGPEDINKKGAVLFESDKLESNMVSMNLYNQKIFAGTIVSIDAFKPITQGYIELFEKFAEIISEYKTVPMALDTAGNIVFESFLKSFIEKGSCDEEFLKDNLQLIGWKEDDSYCVAVLDLYYNEKIQLNSQLQAFRAKGLECVSLYYNGTSIVVFHLFRKNVEQYIENISVIFRDYLVKYGMSNIFNNFRQFPGFYTQALIALNMGLKYDEQIWGYHFKDYALKFFMEQCANIKNAKQLYHPGVVKLYEYDKENKTEYIDTLEVYLSHEKNLGKIANMLHLHRNSLMYRIDIMKRIMNTEIVTEDEAEYMRITIHMIKITNYH